MFLDIYTVCFFGHRYLDNYKYAEQRLEEVVRDLILSKEYVDFLVGRDGQFDHFVSAAIRRAKRNTYDANSSHICVLPYARAEYTNDAESFENYYDEIEICSRSTAAHPKSAIKIRNQYMIDRSDLCIFYIEHFSGGAYQAMKYAQKCGKKIINLAELPQEEY